MLGVIGDLVQDVVVWQREPLRPGTDTASDVVLARGGSAANVAAFASSRYPTRFIGCVGDDLGGFVLGRELTERGVDVRLQTRGRTGMIVVLIDPDGERTMFPSRGASEQLTAVDPAWLEGVELLHLTAYSFASGTTPDAVGAAVEVVRSAGGRVSLDVSSVGLVAHYGLERFIGLLGRVRPDYLSANRSEAEFLGLTSGEAAGPTLGRLPGAVLLARSGDRPTRVFVDGRVVASVPVPRVEVVRDLTGAGDAFNAGFLTDLLARGWDPEATVAAGHALASRVIAAPGATEVAADGG